MDWNQIMTTIGNWCASTGIKIIVSIIILFIAFKVINALTRKLAKANEKSGKLDPTVFRAIESAIRILAKILVVLCIVRYLGIDTSAVTALIASLGVGVGLAVNGALGNFAGGILLLITRPFKVGDYVSVAGYDGTVEEINVISTKLVTVDNKVVYIPNGTASSSGITNFSEKDLRRVDHTFTIPYEADFEAVKKILEGVLDKEALVLKDPAWTVRVSGGSKNGCELTCRAWVKSADYWDAFFSILENAKHALGENGIAVPGEQLDVRIAK
ncbi:MAG: mechanosensitive ion channel family protein [Lachnospiraceae bacterium]|nr:mechanosensitive ion channel family protein [Lachnospiraceae bacterium]